MAKYKSICSEAYWASSRNEKNVSSRGHFFGSEAGRKAFKKLQRFSVSSTDEASSCAWYRFNAVITLAVDCFVVTASDVEVSSKAHQNDQGRNLEVPNAVAPLKNSNKGGCIPHDSACKVKHLLPIAANTLINSCFNLFRRKAVASGVDVEGKLSLKPLELKIAGLQNRGMELAIGFKMLYNGHCYVVFTALAFKKYVRDWIGLVNVSHVLCLSH